MPSNIPRVVFDCNVFIQALINTKGPAFACRELVDHDKLLLFVSPEVLAEVRDVLNRPKLRQKFPALTAERVDAYLQDLINKTFLMTDVPQQFVYERDPKDEPYINLALAAGARYLVTRDKDLLDLMNEGTPEGKSFRERFSHLVILDPVALLQELSPQRREESGITEDGG